MKEYADKSPTEDLFLYNADRQILNDIGISENRSSCRQDNATLGVILALTDSSEFWHIHNHPGDGGEIGSDYMMAAIMDIDVDSIREVIIPPGSLDQKAFYYENAIAKSEYFKLLEVVPSEADIKTWCATHNSIELEDPDNSVKFIIFGEHSMTKAQFKKPSVNIGMIASKYMQCVKRLESSHRGMKSFEEDNIIKLFQTFENNVYSETDKTLALDITKYK